MVCHLKDNWRELSQKKGSVFINELFEVSKHGYFSLESNYNNEYYFIKSPEGNKIGILTKEEVDIFIMDIDEWRDSQLNKIL